MLRSRGSRVTKEISKVIHFLRHGQAQHNPRAEASRDAGCDFAEFLR